MPVPSTSLTERPRHSHCERAFWLSQAACLACERADHLQWQALARPAVPAGTNAAWPQTISRALRGPAVDRLLARAIGLQRLSHKHRQRNRWRIKPLAVPGQQRLARLEQLRTRQHVEELRRLGCFGLASNTRLALMQNVSGVTIHGGWPSAKMVWVRSNNHPIKPWVSHLLLLSNSNTYARDLNVMGLSKCHSP